MKIDNFNQTAASVNKAGKENKKNEDLLHQPDKVTLSDHDITPADLPSSKLDKLLKHQATKAMSKAELHRHMEGSFTPEIAIKIAKKYNIELPTYDVEALRPMLQVTKDDKDLIAFLTKFNLIGKLFVSKEAIKDLTYEVIKEASKDNVKYMELRFCPLTMAGHGKPYSTNPNAAKETTETKHPKLDPRDVIEGVLEGVKEAAKSFDTDVNLMMIASRKLRLDGAMKTLELAKEYKDRGITSLDLAGDELHYGPEEFTPFFLEAEKAGILTTGHGSEARGPESANTLKKDGHVNRVGHGVRIQEDPEVEKKASAEHWALELCPTSNDQTQAVKNFSKDTYPFDKYDKEGMLVTVNTDDPGVCGVTLSDENEKVMDMYNYSLRKMEDLNLRSLDVAFIPEDRRKHLKAEFLKNYAEVNEDLKRKLEVQQDLEGK